MTVLTSVVVNLDWLCFLTTFSGLWEVERRIVNWPEKFQYIIVTFEGCKTRNKYVNYFENSKYSFQMKCLLIGMQIEHFYKTNFHTIIHYFYFYKKVLCCMLRGDFLFWNTCVVVLKNISFWWSCFMAHKYSIWTIALKPSMLPKMCKKWYKLAAISYSSRLALEKRTNGCFYVPGFFHAGRLDQ